MGEKWGQRYSDHLPPHFNEHAEGIHAVFQPKPKVVYYLPALFNSFQV